MSPKKLCWLYISKNVSHRAFTNEKSADFRENKNKEYQKIIFFQNPEKPILIFWNGSYISIFKTLARKKWRQTSRRVKKEKHYGVSTHKMWNVKIPSHFLGRLGWFSGLVVQFLGHPWFWRIPIFYPLLGPSKCPILVEKVEKSNFSIFFRFFFEKMTFSKKN